MSDDPIDLKLTFHHETDRAILVSEDGDRESGVWLPKSQIEYDEDSYEDGDEISVTIPEWLAKRSYLI